ncbi:MAG: tetratricopeptide repeat protein [Gammaproteobacteria bacterium]|nr:tetratricopeptide repeat protein [Gammaproteobacteria bacterium]
MKRPRSAHHSPPVGAGPARDGILPRLRLVRQRAVSDREQGSLPQVCRRIGFAVTLLLGIAILPAHAQNDLDGFNIPGTPTLCFGMLGITEQRALAICDALTLKENVRARELAQSWIAEQPNSAAAQFALAEVLIRVEGNLARGLFHLARAEELTNYTSLGRAMADGGAEWHYLALSQLSYVHQLMGNQQASLDYLDKIEAVYGQEVESFRGWPLIKMQKWDEARASANLVLNTSNDVRERSRAWNTLCAVELASLRPAESLEACDKSISEDEAAAEDESGVVDTVYLLNASEVALSMLRMEEAEDYLTRASRYLNPDSVGDPWINLLYLYMNQGRFEEARTALDNLLVWRDNQEPIVGVMNRAEHFLVSAALLILTGYPEDAATLSATALNQPDRTGSYSADEAQKDSIAALINHMANQTAYEMKLEEIAILPFPESLSARAEALSLRFKSWRSARHAAALFANTTTLQNRLRPYAPLDVHIPEWVEPELVSIIGAGVMSSVLEQTLAAGAFSLNEGYYHAYHAEIAALRGQDLLTIEHASRAMNMLPTQEVLLKARLAARIADAAWRLGETEIALSSYEQALEWDPSVIRRLGLALPVHITSVDDEFVREVIGYLESSPRFRNHPDGLLLEVFPQSDLTLCLSTRGGSPLSCLQMGDVTTLEIGVDGETEPLTPAQQLVKTFHNRTFGPGIEISQTQRMALMGSSVILSSQNNATVQRNRDAVLQ